MVNVDNKDLRIVVWKANGIQQKHTELQAFLNIQKIDIGLISETHLTNQTYSNFKVQFLPKYNFDLDSDHSPVILTVSEKIIKKEHKPTLTNKLTNWEGFQKVLEDLIQLNVSLKTKEQLEKEAKNFIISVQQAAWRNTPELKRKIESFNYP